MLAHAIEAKDFDALVPADFFAEWKWDGIRVQAAAGAARGRTHRPRLYSRTGEDISAAFPDLTERLASHPAQTFSLDGELLILREGRVATFRRAAAEAQPQDGLGEAARRFSGAYSRL